MSPGKRHFDTPKTLPRRQAEAAAGLIEIAWNGPQRLIETESHVPGLGRENSEDRGQFRPEDTAGKERHKEQDGER
jgi:hypothetical protein